MLGSAVADPEFLVTRLAQKIQQTEDTSAKLSKFGDFMARYNVLTFSVNNKLRHLLRSLPSCREPVADFCTSFDNK